MNKLLLAFTLLFVHNYSFGQFTQPAIQADSAYINPAIEKYKQFIGDALPLYNGKAEENYQPFTKGNPYFISPNWQYGSVSFEGVHYKDVWLRYDEVKDNLIIQHPEYRLTIYLFSPRVQYFTLLGSTFVYISASDKSLMKSGFYQLVASGKLTILAKREKVIEEVIIMNVLERNVMEKITYYAMLNGSYYRIQKLNEILKLLNINQHDIRIAFKTKHLKFRKDPEKSLLQISEIYNHSN